MIEDILEKAVKLPLEKQQEVEDFVDYLLSKYCIETVDFTDISKQRIANLGWARGLVWMADDFNETPDDFKDYL